MLRSLGLPGSRAVAVVAGVDPDQVRDEVDDLGLASGSGGARTGAVVSVTGPSSPTVRCRRTVPGSCMLSGSLRQGSPSGARVRVAE